MVILDTERLRFRTHQLSDLEPYCAIEADAEVRRFVGGAPRSHEAAERRFRRLFLKPAQTRLKLWAAVLKASGGYVGYAGVYPHFQGPGHTVPGEGALGFTFAREVWGMGLASEA